MGKVIGIMGHTRSGKSHLARRLGEHYSAPVLYEDAEKEFPERIQSSIRDGSRPLERFLFFRNRAVEMQLEAAHLAEEHPLVFIDAVWPSSRPYIPAYGADSFEQERLHDLCEIDEATLSWPDVVIVLTEDDRTAHDLWLKSGKQFETSPDYYEQKLLPIKRSFDAYIEKLTIPITALRIDRSGLDFDDPHDLKKITDQIDAIDSEALRGT